MLCKQQTDNFYNIMRETSLVLRKLDNKKDMVKLMFEHKLGNSLRSWESLSELNLEENPPASIGIRCKRPDSEFCKYYVKQHNIKKIISEWMQNDETLDITELYFSESAPDNDLIFQGEFMVLSGEPILFMSKQKLPMREALAMDGFHITGPKALTYLKSKMAKKSWADFILLHLMYVASVIEFSVYSRYIGRLPKSNTLIWEVRNY